MLYASIIFFTLTACFGAATLTNWLQHRRPPRWLVYGHGLLAATALVLLLIYAYNSPSSWLNTLVLFLIAATGGFYMFFRDVSGRTPPRVVMWLHAILAASAFASVLIYTFG